MEKSVKMNCLLESQLKIIAVIEIVVSAFFLGLNLKILIQLLLGHRNDADQGEEQKVSKHNLSDSALIFYFLLRVIYLVGEVLLAIYLTYNVYKVLSDNLERSVNGLILWIFMTIIFSIPSRCYFIGGILWGQYFIATVLIFSANLAFTAYSLVVICLYVKNLTGRRGSVGAAATEYTDTFLDFL